MPHSHSLQRQPRRLPRRKLALLVAFIASLAFPLLLSTVGLFLALWIVVPAPTFFLLPLGVGAPEVSPWLIGLNAIASLLSLKGFSQSGISRVGLGMSLVGLGLSLLPLLQFPAVDRQARAAMHASLGADYLTQLSPTVQATLRPHPLVLLDVFRGIPDSALRVTTGIPFATVAGVTLRMNVYRPPQVGQYPTLICIYGGAWQNGTPDNDASFSRYMAARGYTVIAIDYRHAPAFRFPAQLQDVQTALAFIRQHAEEYEVDVDRLALMGRSAGAHLALLAAYQPEAPAIRAVVDYYGPVELTQGYYDLPFPDPINTRRVLTTFLGGTPEEMPDQYYKASPLHSVRPSLPPTLLVYGKRDHLVQAKFGRSLYDHLIAQGNRAIWLEIPWAEHAFDAVFNGVSNQLALYYTERFLAWALHPQSPTQHVSPDR